MIRRAPNPNLGKYRLRLGGELMMNFHPDIIKDLIKGWLDSSGALNVGSSVIKATKNEDYLEYSVTFDSSCWTGINFKGFNTQNRNFS